MASLDSFKAKKKLAVGSKTYHYYSLAAAEKNGLKDVARLPYSLKSLLENLLRNEDGRAVTKETIQAFAGWLTHKGKTEVEIAFRPARVLMQDFTGVPAVVDLAAMRDAFVALGGDPQKINPLAPVDLVIDHSVIVDQFGSARALKENVALEYGRNGERYRFLKWGQEAFDNFRVVPPGAGICHQVNLEYLAQTVWTKKEKIKHKGKSETIDGPIPTRSSARIPIRRWSTASRFSAGASAASRRRRPCSASRRRCWSPEVIGFKLMGEPREGVTATDVVLTVTQMLRKKGVVGKFVEFFGDGLPHLSLADRATIANMAPEYGATCGFFPIDQVTLDFLKASGRSAARVALVEAYAKAQGMFRTARAPDRSSPTR